MNMLSVIPAEIIRKAIQSFTDKNKDISPTEFNEKVSNCQVNFIKLHLTALIFFKKENVILVTRF